MCLSAANVEDKAAQWPIEVLIRSESNFLEVGDPLLRSHEDDF